MTPWKLTMRSISHYRRSAAAVAFGVVVGSAALTGSLLMGDSVKGSLREMALERLGRADYALVSQGYFTEGLAERLASQPGVTDEITLAVPVIILSGTVRSGDGKTVVPGVTVIGVRDDFWKMVGPLLKRTGGGDVPIEPDGRRVAINATLAEALGARGDEDVVLSVGRRQQAPSSSVFARRSREDTVGTARLSVSGIAPASGAGAFKLTNDTSAPRNLYISMKRLQRILDLPGKANTLLVSMRGGVMGAEGELGRLQDALAGSTEIGDYGLRLLAGPKGTGVRAFSLQSQSFVLPGGVLDGVGDMWGEGVVKRSSVHLANFLRVAGRGPKGGGIPYSVVAAVESMKEPPFEGFMISSGEVAGLGDGEMVLNAWAAEDLGAQVGDTVELDHYVSGPRGDLTTETLRFKLRGVVMMWGTAVRRGIVPEFEGITDAEAMGEWDPPFPVDLSKIRAKDDDYWEAYRTAPKAWVSMATMRRIWRASEGAAGTPWVSSLHFMADEQVLRKIPKGVAPADILARHVAKALRPASLGLSFRPVRAQALRAAEGPTDFGVLFLSMSFFLVIASAALIGLLLRLAAERRASQTGILLATGFTGRWAARMLLREGMVISAAGVAIGVPAGVGYAWVLMRALSTRWSGAVGAARLSLHVTESGLVIGAVAGLVVSYLAIRWAARALGRTDVLVLLGGWRAMSAAPPSGSGRLLAVACGAAAGAGALLVLSLAVGVVPAAAAFFGIGALLLVGAVALFGAAIRRPGGAAGRGLSLMGLAFRSASLNRLRSMTTVALLACASFMIVAVSANRSDLSRLDTSRVDSGSGGFEIAAASDVPVYADLDTDGGRSALGLDAAARTALEGVRVYSCRLTRGDEASCLNIQRPVAPRVRSVPRELVERGGFTFTAHAELPEAARGNPWHLLSGPLPDGTIPAFADAATAQWILKIGLGDVVEVPAPAGSARLRVVGLIPQSIFASELVVSEEGFIRAFGPEGGYSAFLIDAPGERAAEIARLLRGGLGDFGFDAVRTADSLAAYARVQNTYLSTFETLGGLGLLLGTFGVVAVLLRNVMDYRGELAMMLAMGFRRGQLIGMILAENAALLVAGVAAGTASALVAVAPQLAGAASGVEWPGLGLTILASLATGVISCAIAARASMRGDLVAALRSE